MSQLNYDNSMPPPVAGAFGEIGDSVALTRRVPANQELQAGLAVEWWGGSSDDEISEVSQDAKPLGVSGRNTLSTSHDVDGVLAYQEGEELPVLTKGKIWVRLDGPVAPEDPVFVRYRFFTQIISVVFDADFVTGNTINGTVGGEAIAPVTYATSHTATFNALVSAVNATALTRLISSNPATRTMLITVDPDVAEPLDPLGDYVSTTGFTVTGGASQAVDTVTENRAPSTGMLRGGFRADDDDTGAGATAFELSQARFVIGTSGPDGETVALIDLNLP